MAKRPALKLETEYRSWLEEKVAAQLEGNGIAFGYENLKVKFLVPAREAKYTPDFVCGELTAEMGRTTKVPYIILEAKGYFRKTSDRQRLIQIKEAHPSLDIRLVFQDASKPIYKGSKTTYAKWAQDHGFMWADKGTVPLSWIKQMQQQQGKKKR